MTESEIKQLAEECRNLSMNCYANSSRERYSRIASALEQMQQQVDEAERSKESRQTETAKEWSECETPQDRISRIERQIQGYEDYLESDNADSGPAFGFACNAAHTYLPWLLEQLAELRKENERLKDRLVRRQNDVIDRNTRLIEKHEQLAAVTSEQAPTSPKQCIHGTPAGCGVCAEFPEGCKMEPSPSSKVEDIERLMEQARRPSEQPPAGGTQEEKE